MPFCQNCGNQIPDGANNCPSCGAPMMQQQPFQQAPTSNQPQWNSMPNANSQQPQPKKKKHGCLIAIGVFFLIGLIGSITGGIRKNASPEQEQAPSIITEMPDEESESEPESKSAKPVTKAPETEAKPTETEPEESTEPELSASEIQQMIKDGDFSLVTPEFKDYLDSYEAFMDDYVAFMKKYNSGEGDIMAMMNDYMDMLTKMQEWSAKIDAIDEAELSIADDAYYLLVTVRVEKKLLSVI